MTSLRERLDLSGGEPRLGDAGALAVDAVLRRLEADGPAGAANVPAADLLACLAFGGLGDDASIGPALVQRDPPRPAIRRACDEPTLAAWLPAAPRTARLALAAGLLQIHDFWDPSHEAAQAADDLGERAFSAYWHGIAHRREPDAGNAAYWFRRVGLHAVFAPLARAARPILDAQGDDRWTARILGRGGWDPQAMIDFCVGAGPDTPREATARRLQRLEMQLLLDATAAAVLPPE